MSLENSAWDYARKSETCKPAMTFLDGATFAGWWMRDEKSIKLIADEFHAMFSAWCDGETQLDWESAARSAIEEVLGRE